MPAPSPALRPRAIRPPPFVVVAVAGEVAVPVDGERNARRAAPLGKVRLNAAALADDRLDGAQVHKLLVALERGAVAVAALKPEMHRGHAPRRCPARRDQVRALLLGGGGEHHGGNARMDQVKPVPDRVNLGPVAAARDHDKRPARRVGFAPLLRAGGKEVARLDLRSGQRAARAAAAGRAPWPAGFDAVDLGGMVAHAFDGGHGFMERLAQALLSSICAAWISEGSLIRASSPSSRAASSSCAAR
jgi:hypothetical protein